MSASPPSAAPPPPPSANEQASYALDPALEHLVPQPSAPPPQPASTDDASSSTAPEPTQLSDYPQPTPAQRPVEQHDFLPSSSSAAVDALAQPSSSLLTLDRFYALPSSAPTMSPLPLFAPDDLPVAPNSPTEQIALLREMDEDADAALLANRAYQDELGEVMRRLERARKRAGELKALVTALRAELDSTVEVKVVADGFREPTLPWFKWKYGKDLPPNPDGEARDRYLATIRSIPWSPAERAQLRQEVIMENHRLFAAEVRRRGGDPIQAAEERGQEWFVESLDGLDWERIATPFDRRTPAACRIQWTQRDHPSLLPAEERENWSAEEKKKLREAVRKHGEKGWGKVAEAVGNGRTPLDCVRQHRRDEGAPKPPKKLAIEVKEEDENIREAIQLYGEDWQAVAKHTSLSPTYCLTRWSTFLHPTLRRGRWTTAEDAALRRAIATCGRHWVGVARLVPGRSDAQCRERWSEQLDPRLLDKKEWTEEEEALVLRLRDEEGLSWSDIARQGFEGRRTDGQILRRYTDLQKRAQPGYVKPKLGRPKKSERKGKGGKGVPKKTAKARQKEQEARWREEREFEAWAEGEGLVVEEEGEEGQEGQEVRLGGAGGGDDEEEEEEEVASRSARGTKRKKQAAPSASTSSTAASTAKKRKTAASAADKGKGKGKKRARQEEEVDENEAETGEVEEIGTRRSRRRS
ncbi:hypothetical protein JCM8097_006877 [Rhodosporidiobolus ruineniae]